MSDTIDFSKIATNLEPGEDGIWYSNYRSRISYPEDQHAECYAVEDSSFWFEHRANCIVTAMQRYPPGGLLFDVGGGNGHVSLAIQSADMRAVLVEPGEEGAVNAHARGLKNIICSTLQDAGFQPSTIPAIGLFDVLEHIENDEGFLSILHTVLSPEGRIYITVPAFGFLWSSEDVAAGHYRRYTLSSLSHLLAAQGFEIEYSTYFFSLLPLPIFIRRTLPTKLGVRSVRQHERNRREHMQPKRAAGSLLSSALAMELRTIGNGKRLPLGSSCLIVAKSRQSPQDT